MASVNKVILLGNLGADPEIKYTQGGDAVALLRLATTETWKDKSGEKQEATEWHRAVIYGKLAEVAGEYLKKGSPVYLEGRLNTRQWDDKDGVKRYTTEIKCDRLQLLGGKPEGKPEGQQQRPAPKQQEQKPAPKKQGGMFDEMDDDIPF